MGKWSTRYFSIQLLIIQVSLLPVTTKQTASSFSQGPTSWEGWTQRPLPSVCRVVRKKNKFINYGILTYGAGKPSGTRLFPLGLKYANGGNQMHSIFCKHRCWAKETLKMGDHIIYGPNWGVPNSDKVFINHYSGKTDTHQDFLRRIRIYGDPLRKKSGGLRWLSGKKKKKKFACQPRRLGSNSWVGKILGGRHGNPLQYSCLENPMDRGAWQATDHRIAERWTWPSTHALKAALSMFSVNSDHGIQHGPLVKSFPQLEVAYIFSLWGFSTLDPYGCSQCDG